MSIADEYRRPLTAQEAVLSELRRKILEGEIGPGEPIRQGYLADQLQTSRVPVREALKTLEGENLVTYVPHRGYTVADLDYDELAEIYHIRRLLESDAVQAALVHLTAAGFEQLKATLDEIEAASEAGEIATVAAANRRFHFGLFRPSGMNRLVRLIENLWDASDSYRSVYFADRANLRRINLEHRQVLGAAIAGDTYEVLRLLQFHRDHALSGLRLVLKSGDRSATGANDSATLLQPQSDNAEPPRRKQ